MTIKNVTFIGLGVMGFPMAGHLKNNNFNVTVFNRTASKTDSWIKKHQGFAKSTISEASQNSEIVFVPRKVFKWAVVSSSYLIKSK